MTVPRVFISSTIEDLADYREAARIAVRKARCDAELSQDWPARGTPPLETCLQEVDRADLLIVIVAHRFGWAPPDQPDGEHKSITWLECARAKSRKVQVIPFLVDDNAQWPGDRYESARMNNAASRDEIDEIWRNVNALKDFQKWLDTIATRSTRFTTTDSLKTEILAAIAQWKEETGWTDPPEDDHELLVSRRPAVVEDRCGYCRVAEGTGRYRRVAQYPEVLFRGGGGIA